MLKKMLSLFFLIVLLAAVAGCASQPAEAPVEEAPAEEAAPAGEVALKVTGKVDNEMGWTEAEIKAMETMDAERENKEGVMETYTGVSLNALLDEAGVSGDATKVVFVADDGYEAEVALADLRACENCIASFRSQGGFSTVLPGFPNNVQVKGVIEMRVE